MKSFKIGLAGYMGAGKTTCSQIFVDHGAAIINADHVAKYLMEQDRYIKKRLIEEFGNGICNNEKISFAKLGRIVFSSMDKIRKLNSVVHPPLLDTIHKLLTGKQDQIVVLDASLIPLWNIDNWFDIRIWVYAPFVTRLERILNKPECNLSRDQISKRMILQQKLFSPPSVKNWKYVLNDGKIEAVKNAIGEIVEVESI
ncbi:MAG: dephospho-CoA kinase [Fibrobacter sp.]|nr:dephospho-CoA kinase [Fibrobacter sp.]